MIIDIPTKEDFEQSGTTFLNLAWDSVIGMLFDLQESSEKEEGLDRSDEYWKAAQGKLAVALALAEQGIEFLLKARIIEISPFLLIARNPKDWPSNCESVEVPFATFRTIDAQDLIRVHDTVVPLRLPDPFKRRYDALRRKRNVILHTVDPELRISAKEVVLEILEASNALIGRHAWPRKRRLYLRQMPIQKAFASHDEEQDEVDENDELAMEMDIVIKNLTPAEAKALLGFFKTRRRYYCPTCYQRAWKHAEDIPRLAQLSSRSPGETDLQCIVCGSITKVSRVRCMCTDCKGNVIEPPRQWDGFGYHEPHLPEEASEDRRPLEAINDFRREMAFPVCLSCWSFQITADGHTQ